MKTDDLDFKVLEAYTRDIGRGVARIDEITMNTMSLTAGDIIEITGKQRTVAKCLSLYPADENKKIVRFDGLIRNNCQTMIGNRVFLRKIKSTLAKEVTVIPNELIPLDDGRYLTDALDGVPLVLHQNIMVPHFGGRLTFQVVSTIPHIDDDVEAVIVSQKTVFHIQEGKKQFPDNGDISAKRQFILHQFWRLEDLDDDEFEDLISKMSVFYKELRNKKNSDKL